MLDPDDPTFRGKTWDAVEKALNERDQFMMAVSGYDVERGEERGPSFVNPSRPLYATFPWEEKVAFFEKPATCGYRDWSHTCLKYHIGKHVATLQLARAGSNNCLNPALLDALQDAIIDLQDQRDVRLVVLKSEGKFFSQGFDREYLLSESSMTEAEVIQVHRQFAKILFFFQRLPQLTVALVQGSAMGAAVGLLCTCDVVLSVKGAFYAMSETMLGAVASTSIPYITRRITYIKHAYQLVLAGASLSAETACEYGIVTQVVEDEAALEEELKSLCERMTSCAPGAVAATKEVVVNTVGVAPSSFMLNYVAGILAEVRKGPESRGGLQAIQSRQKPAWVESPIVP